jgi:tetratricopeptide (TPR) repeat protein
MNVENVTTTSVRTENPVTRHLTFFAIVIVIISAAIVRSNITTQLDSFTIDEAYHIGAGAAYVETADFRLNPEHPPLVKLWVGAFVSGLGYEVSQYRRLADKADERMFVENDVYLNNDPDVIQGRARIAMFALNALLLLLLAVAIRRVFGHIIALGAIAFLAIDPTVAAHLPVVMTDLPVALLSGSAVLFAIAALRSWGTADLIVAALTLGLALSSKHSAVITAAAIAVIGVVLAVFFASGAGTLTRLRRVGSVALVLIGAMVVLWSFYMFRFSESPLTSDEQFNRSLAEKIGDVNSPNYRMGLNIMASGHLFPRAYTWGMADTIRAGAEGRARAVYAFGRKYTEDPLYIFPGIVAAKLPIGLMILSLIGVGILILRKVPQEFYVPILAVLTFAGIFLIVLATGSSYGGIRHALPLVPVFAVLGALAIYTAVESRSYLLGGVVSIALLAALVSAVPVMRPWEYYNEIAGGPSNAYRYFSDEGIDAELRVKELVKYYNENLRDAGEVPYLMYPVHQPERERRDLDWVGKDMDRDEERLSNETVTGTVIMGARRIARLEAFRDAEPIARFGNLFVYLGTFKFPEIRNASLTQRARRKIYTANPDIEGAIKLLVLAVEVNPRQFSNAIELGNQYLKTGNREEAVKAYELAKEHAPPQGETSALILKQLERLVAEPLEQISPLRNPQIE